MSVLILFYFSIFISPAQVSMCVNYYSCFIHIFINYQIISIYIISNIDIENLSYIGTIRPYIRDFSFFAEYLILRKCLQLIHLLFFKLERRMKIVLHCNFNICMSKNFAQSFYIASGSNTSGCKGMTQTVKVFV